jgi:hypothetical protein
MAVESTSITSALTSSLATFARKAFVVLVVTIAATVASSALIAGCEKKGPAEKAGEDIDKATKKTGEAVKDAGEKIKDAGR